MCHQKIVSTRQLTITSVQDSRAKIVQRSGMIVKMATQPLIKSGPWVIIRASSQRNWDQRGGRIWETSYWPTWGISHAIQSSMTRIYYAPCDRQRISSFDERTNCDFRTKRSRKPDNCWTETLYYKYGFSLSFFVMHSEIRWCHCTVAVPVIPFKNQEASGGGVSVARKDLYAYGARYETVWDTKTETDMGFNGACRVYCVQEPHFSESHLTSRLCSNWFICIYVNGRHSPEKFLSNKMLHFLYICFK